MIRRLIAGLVVVGLAIGVWALWPRDEPDRSPTTTVNAVDSTTNTSAPDPVTSTTLESHVVTTVEEAEVVLRELWFGWFEGIYNQDEDRIKQVVGSQVLLDSAREAFSTMTFNSTPSPAASHPTCASLTPTAATPRRPTRPAWPRWTSTSCPP